MYSKTDDPGHVAGQIFLCRSILLVAVATSFSDMSESLLGPYYPSYAQEKGVSIAVIGAMFSLEAVVALLITPLAPIVMERAGSPVNVLRAGLFCQAALELVWSFTNRVPGTSGFVASCAAVRAVQGLVLGLTETAAASVAMRSASQELVGDAVGYVEASRGIGAMIGPVVGGLLFQVGGYSAPSLFSAAMLFAVGMWTLCPVPLLDAGATPSVGIVRKRELLRVPTIAVLVVFMVGAMLSFSFLEPTLQPHLETQPYNLQSSTIGLLFAVVALTYACATLVAAPLARRVGAHVCVVGGMVGLGLVFLLIGPSPLLPFVPKTVWMFAVVMFLCGVAVALVSVPSEVLLTRAAAGIRGGQIQVPTQDFADNISAISTFAISLGAILGPLVAGALVQVMSFEWATTIFGLVLIGMGLGLGPVICCSQGHGMEESLLGSPSDA